MLGVIGNGMIRRLIGMEIRRFALAKNPVCGFNEPAVQLPFSKDTLLFGADTLPFFLRHGFALNEMRHRQP